MKAEVCTRDEFSKEELENLSNQGVDLDDWNYALVCDPKYLIGWNGVYTIAYEIEKVLGYTHIWKVYNVEIGGEMVGLVVSYH